MTSLYFNPIVKHFEHDRDEAETFDEVKFIVGLRVSTDALEGDIAISLSSKSFYKKSGFCE